MAGAAGHAALVLAGRLFAAGVVDAHGTGDGADQGERYHYAWYRADQHPELAGELGFYLNPEALPELYPANSAA